MEKLLEKKIEMIEVKIAAEIKQAKKLGIKNKNHAMKCLVRKKSLEKQLQITCKKSYRLIYLLSILFR